MPLDSGCLYMRRNSHSSLSWSDFELFAFDPAVKVDCNLEDGRLQGIAVMPDWRLQDWKVWVDDNNDFNRILGYLGFWGPESWPPCGSLWRAVAPESYPFKMMQ